MCALRADNETRHWRAQALAVRTLLAGHAGCTAVQIGGCRHDCFPPGRFLDTYCVERGAEDADLCADAAALPLMSEKVDLLIMMHFMDRHGPRDEWMGEAVRVLRPEGNLVVVGRYLWPHEWLRPHKAPLGAWALHRLVVRHGLYWEGIQRLQGLHGVYLAKARRRMLGVRPIKPHWRKQAARRSLEVPGAGRAG